MKATQSGMLELLGRPDAQLVVPVYQRVYSWTKPQLRQLWDDLSAAGEQGAPHFMGSIFFSDDGPTEAGIGQLDIIDGQQRLTTLTLLLCAVRDHLRETGDAFEGLDADSFAATYLLGDTPEGPGCKLVLSRADAPTLRWVVGVGPKPVGNEDYSKLVVESYEWFKKRIGADSFDVHAFLRGLREARIIAVQMEAGDRPQTVFESLNSKGLPLSTPDLVRNYLLMREGFASPSHLYDAYWAKVEDAFADDEDDRYLSHALRTWVGRGPAIKDDHDIFAAFKVAFANTDPEKLERRIALLADYCIDFHEKVASGDEATLKACREWEESRGKAERLRNGRRIFGD